MDFAGFPYQRLADQCARLPQHPWTQVRWFGQPASQTHPHLLQHGEVTPGITKEEYQERRARLMERILSNRKNLPTGDHIVIIPSASKVFMTHDIPYQFRQHTDFLYLSGFQEPDSILILESSSTDSLSNHRSTLFVPRKDARKELWEGPRSGASGAIELTGIEHAYNSDELPDYLNCYLKDHRGFVTWYDYQKPAQLDFHMNQMRFFLREASIRPGMLENPRKLIQSLRVIKSPSEIALMQKSCDIASRAFREVMRYSHPQVGPWLASLQDTSQFHWHLIWNCSSSRYRIIFFCVVEGQWRAPLCEDGLWVSSEWCWIPGISSRCGRWCMERI